MLRETARVGKHRHRQPSRTSPTGPTACSVLTRPHARDADALPYEWYDTPNIRVGTYKDFEVLAGKNALDIKDAFGLQDGREVRWLPNLRAGTAVFRFERG
jgi:hypothetical protein